VYSADRAAALSGVPKSTLYYWARKGLYIPSISNVREKRWSFADLLAMRAIYWLRQDKPEIDTARTTMHHVQAALAEARRIGIPMGSLNIYVDVEGMFFYKRPDSTELSTIGGQTVAKPMLDHFNLLTEFRVGRRLAPDLRQPRPHLRIIPGKLAGEPHVEGTRIQTAQVAALVKKGMDTDAIKRLYPALKQRDKAIKESVDLERQLTSNLRQAA
jgi:uncharacterized protein (DUF433 family)/DNA-binding transcriptional MerR regulator